MAAADFVADAAETVADGAAAGINFVGELVSDVVETVGNLVEDGLNLLGGALADALGAPGIRDVFAWLGAVVSGGFDLLAAALKAAAGILAAHVQGLIKLWFGILTLHWDLVEEGLFDFAFGVAGAVLIMVGKLVALLQTISLQQAPERPLTRVEFDVLKRVFRESIALYNVRIVEGQAGLANNRILVVGNTIYAGSGTLSHWTLVHEATHVWQYQNTGARYLMDAVRGQSVGYSWEAEIGRGNMEWVDFNKEAQGQFFEDLWRVGQAIRNDGTDVTGNGAFFDAGGARVGLFMFNNTDHTDRANRAVEVVRRPRASRVSNIWS